MAAALGALILAAGAGFWAIDMSSGGVSSRSPLFLLAGFAAVAALPALYFALRPTADKDSTAGAASALGVGELDAVIHHVTRDLERQSIVAPAHSLALVGPGQEVETGALSAVADAMDGAVAIADQGPHRP